TPQAPGTPMLETSTTTSKRQRRPAALPLTRRKSSLLSGSVVRKIVPSISLRQLGAAEARGTAVSSLRGVAQGYPRDRPQTKAAPSPHRAQRRWRPEGLQG